MRLRALFAGRAKRPAEPHRIPAAPAAGPGAAVASPPAVVAPSLELNLGWLTDAADPLTAVFLGRIGRALQAGPINLPCFPDIVPRVRQALDDPETTADDLVRIAATEPRLAARLLQTANSAVFNTSGVPVRDLRSAVNRLGHNLLQSVTMAFAVQQMRADVRLKSVAVPLAELWEKSMAVASICEVIARELRVPPDKVFLTGLLHGIGQFYILVSAATESDSIDVQSLDPALLRAAHPAFGRAVLQRWNFETIVCEAVGRQHDRSRESAQRADITDVVVASVVLAEVRATPERDLGPCWETSAFERLALGPKQLAQILSHTDHVLDSLKESLAG